MGDRELEDVEYRAEFERQQFELYETRRLTEETHTNAVIAATLAVGALVLADYARKGHPDFGWLLAALLGLLWTFGFALITRYVSPKTSPRFGGKKLPLGTVRAADPVKKTLDAIRDTPEEGPELREQARADWRARAISAHDLPYLSQIALSGP